MRTTAPAILCVVLLVVGPTLGAPFQQSATLDGTWLVTSAVFNGQSFDSARGELLIRIVGNSYEQVVNGHVDERGTIRVDRSKTPMAIDFVIVEGVAANMTQRGIAEVSDNTLKLHLGQPGANGRAIDFTPLADHMLITATKK